MYVLRRCCSAPEPLFRAPTSACYRFAILLSEDFVLPVKHLKNEDVQVKIEARGLAASGVSLPRCSTEYEGRLKCELPRLQRVPGQLTGNGALKPSATSTIFRMQLLNFRFIIIHLVQNNNHTDLHSSHFLLNAEVLVFGKFLAQK